MFLGAYHYGGPPDALLAGYWRLASMIPADSLDLHVCVARDAGILVLDACPSAEVFAGFSAGEDFRGLHAAARLPLPQVEALGVVEQALLRSPVGLGARP